MVVLEQPTKDLTTMEQFTNFFGDVSHSINNWVLLYVLIGLGIYFTVFTKGVQFRYFGRMFKAMATSRTNKGQSLSSFQAFTVGLASRVGTGNIAGVALALIWGGPGALFWMWVIALIGMATSFMESTLAQMYKVPWGDRIYRGGPAYYIERGLGSRLWGVIFAILLVFSYGLIFPMIQANTIATQFKAELGISEWGTAVVLVLISIPIILRGLRVVARVTELLVPFMAVVYLIIATVIVLMNLTSLPGVLGDIFAGAFGIRAGLAGTAGGLFATFSNGAVRGLFSNEAGQGSMPNGAATADVRHPVVQGFVQAFGTFVDTILVCSATGFMILLAGPSVYQPGQEYDDGILTQSALTFHLEGQDVHWTVAFMTLVVFLFCYSSVLGYSVFAEININYLKWGALGIWGLRILMILAVGVGAIIALELAWNLADIALAVMTIVNMIAMGLLAKNGFLCLKDYDRQRQQGIAEPIFISAEVDLPHPIPESVWTREHSEATQSQQG
ncbi:MAG: alanine/glycine:cation symporter family protein [Actinomycetaceae bacterium]|nr:alanine/glycine:cation symporter family protein [Actinomycetaceae bacterium]